MHEDLFRATALSSTETFAPLGKIVNPLIGIDVKLPDTCKHCGSDLAVIGAAPCRIARRCIVRNAGHFADGFQTAHSSLLVR
jgi:hypothetical protein